METSRIKYVFRNYLKKNPPHKYMIMNHIRSATYHQHENCRYSKYNPDSSRCKIHRKKMILHVLFAKEIIRYLEKK